MEDGKLLIIYVCPLQICLFQSQDETTTTLQITSQPKACIFYQWPISCKLTNVFAECSKAQRETHEKRRVNNQLLRMQMCSKKCELISFLVTVLAKV